ncbi:Phospholipase D, partial [Bienertia sinuspersici]
MARIPLSKQKKIATTCIVIYRHMMDMLMEIIFDLMYLLTIINIKIPNPLTYVFDNSVEERYYARILNINPMIQGSDLACLDNLRMDRACFYKFCEVLRDVAKLQGNRNASLEEIVALFLFTLPHDTKNRRTQLYFRRSGETVSRHFKLVLQALLRCHHILFKKPEPVTENCQDDKWKWFQVMETSTAWNSFRFELATEIQGIFRQSTNGSNSTRNLARWSICEDRALVSAMNDLIDLDRAVGNEAENVFDVLEDMEEEERGGEELQAPHYDVEETSTTSQCSPTGPPPSTTRSTKTKRARAETIEALKEFSTKLAKISGVMEGASEHIRRLANCFQNESNSAERRMKVTGEIMKMEGLTPNEVIMVSKKIVLNPLEVDFFFSLPEDYKFAYVQ